VTAPVSQAVAWGMDQRGTWKRKLENLPVGDGNLQGMLLWPGWRLVIPDLVWLTRTPWGHTFPFTPIVIAHHGAPDT